MDSRLPLPPFSRPGASPRRQPLLFSLRSPLCHLLGDEFFRTLPEQPGVYFFHDAADTLLYIGQSSCLRQRLGSYRYLDPDRHPRRSLRLAARTRRISFQLCATPAEAVALEAALLREKRPSFNRAGVWPGPVWWLRRRFAPAPGNPALFSGRDPLQPAPVRGADLLPPLAAGTGPAAGKLELSLHPASSSGLPPPPHPAGSASDAVLRPVLTPDMDWPSDSAARLQEEWSGPFNAGFRHAFPALIRCLHRALHPTLAAWEAPAGLFDSRPFLHACLPLPADGQSTLPGELTQFLQFPSLQFPQALIRTLESLPPPPSAQQEFWLEQIRQLRQIKLPSTPGPSPGPDSHGEPADSAEV